MKKAIKLSLLGCCLLTSFQTLNAQSLENAIKDVEISGYAAYRYDSFEDRDRDANDYKVSVHVSTKVNEDVKFNTRILAANSDTLDMSSSDSTRSGDENIDVSIAHANFEYTGLSNASIKLGKQHVATPWTNKMLAFTPEVNGSGLTATYNLGQANVLAGYFNQTNVSKMATAAVAGHGLFIDGKRYNYSKTNETDTGENLMYAAVTGTYSGVNAQYWAMTIEDVITSQFVRLDSQFALSDYNFNVFGQYSTSELEDTFKDNTGVKDDDLSIFKAGFTVSKSIYSFGYTYAKTGDNGTGVINKQSLASEIYWTNDLADYYDAESHGVHASAQVTDDLRLGIHARSIETNHGDTITSSMIGPGSTQSDVADETMIAMDAVYNMSANLMINPQIGIIDNDAYEDKSGQFRLNVLYKF